MHTPSEKNLSKLALFTTLKKCSPQVRGRLIQFLNSEGIQVVSELVYNVLFNDSPLTKAQKRKIRKEYLKDKSSLKVISKKRASFKRKRKLLKQTGSGLGTLLGIGLSLLSPYIFGHS